MRTPRTVLLVAALALVTAGAVAGCGSGGADSSHASSQAQALLRATFSGKHAVTSGDIELSLEVVPSGSSILTAPIKVAFGGPFQSGAKGTLPKSDFTVDAAAQGESGKLSIVSTGSAGYITVDGDSYQLPAASYKQLESGFSSVSGSSSASGSGTLKQLGIDPLDWLSDPSIVGTATVGGAQTTRISAKVRVAGLLHDLSKLIGKASSLDAKTSSALSGKLTASEQAHIAADIKSPSFDVWTGKSDRTLRRLAVDVTIPITGTTSKSLGGLKTLRIALTLQYSDLNRPQTVTAPTALQPYSQFEQKLASVLETIESGIGQSELGTGTTTTAAGSGLSSVDKKYSACILKAAGDVAKQQKCTALLGG